MEESSCQVHMFLNGVNSFRKEGLKSSFTAALDVGEIVPIVQPEVLSEGLERQFVARG
jgi:hypothetical protein